MILFNFGREGCFRLDASSLLLRRINIYIFPRAEVESEVVNCEATMSISLIKRHSQYSPCTETVLPPAACGDGAAAPELAGKARQQ